MAHECSPACHASHDTTGKGCECSCGGKSHGQASQPVPAASSDGTVIAASPPTARREARGPAVHVVDRLDEHTDGWWPHAVTITRRQADAISEDLLTGDYAAPVTIEQHRGSRFPEGSVLYVAQGDETACYTPSGRRAPQAGRPGHPYESPSIILDADSFAKLAARTSPPQRILTRSDAYRAIEAHRQKDTRELAAALDALEDSPRLELRDPKEAHPLDSNELAALANAAESDGRHGLAGKIRWGPRGMDGALEEQPPGSTRSYHGVAVDRRDDGWYRVRFPDGSGQAHAMVSESMVGLTVREAMRHSR